MICCVDIAPNMFYLRVTFDDFLPNYRVQVNQRSFDVVEKVQSLPNTNNSAILDYLGNKEKK